MTNQKQFLTSLCEDNPNSVIIGSIGTISYDLNEIEHNNKILVRGAMGGVLAIGLGYALAKPEKEVIVVIGDGSYLMKMGTSATIEKYYLPNLRIIVLNNKKYCSCGFQETNFEYIKDLVPFQVVDIA